MSVSVNISLSISRDQVGEVAAGRRLSPSLSELLADGMLSSRSGMLSSVARSSRCTTIFSLPFDLSISFLASISDRFSVTVPLIWRSWESRVRKNPKTKREFSPLMLPRRNVFHHAHIFSQHYKKGLRDRKSYPSLKYLFLVFVFQLPFGGVTGPRLEG